MVSISLRDLLDAAERHGRPGISTDKALILAAAEITGTPLYPHRPDDAALILRAEQLLAKNGLRQALALARQEINQWQRDSRTTRINRPQQNVVLPEIPVSANGDWECPCGRESADQPSRTIVALREPRCRFCGRPYQDEYRRRP